jgi:PIN domain nuclease of toxin-antitoxin system
VRTLLDTQVWLWMLAAPERLSKRGAALLTSPANELVLSAASIWEIAIKYGLGKIQLPEVPSEYIPRLVARTGVTPLPIHHRHAVHVATLPLHHGDPFDRLLIAQAQIEDIPIVTADPSFSRYDVKVLEA